MRQHAFWTDEPAELATIETVFLFDRGYVTRAIAPRLNRERRCVLYIDRRSTAERTQDPRTPKEILTA